MEDRKIVSSAEWTQARKQLLAREKEFTRLRDQLSEERRNLPWERVEKGYVFEGPGGKQTLSELFEGRNQLIIYHFMFGADWEAGCKSCSFWADNFDNVIVHLNQRDVTMLAVSRAPLDRIDAFRKRMGWTFKWVSSLGSDFNHDYQVSFTPEQQAKGESYYNYVWQKGAMSERPGISVFFKDPGGSVFHTYSCYERGIDMMNTAYHYLDLVPKGRDEANERPYAQAWVRHHDNYGS
jgi:predicted dithiol-disulfide oxidoreductase (DUF899 family)